MHEQLGTSSADPLATKSFCHPQDAVRRAASACGDAVKVPQVSRALHSGCLKGA